MKSNDKLLVDHRFNLLLVLIYILLSTFHKLVNTFLLLDYVVSSSSLTCSPPSYAQILDELHWHTRPNTQDVLLQDPGAVESVPVPLDLAGKVSSYLFLPMVQLKQHNLIGF